MKYKAGMKFGRLTVIKYAEFYIPGTPKLACLCDCGREITVRPESLKSGATKSCGCLRNEIREKVHTKHGMFGTAEYAAWSSMKGRCNNKNHDSYYSYGARGISVCEAWSEFENFYADMGDRPSEKHTLERKNNNGSYGPNNCKWATRGEQSKNIRSNRNLTFNGKTQCVSAWAEELNIPISVLRNRIRHGWTTERTLTQRIKLDYRR